MWYYDIIVYYSIIDLYYWDVTCYWYDQEMTHDLVWQYYWYHCVCCIDLVMTVTGAYDCWLLLCGPTMTLFHWLTVLLPLRWPWQYDIVIDNDLQYDLTHWLVMTLYLIYVCSIIAIVYGCVLCCTFIPVLYWQYSIYRYQWPDCTCVLTW